MIFSTDPADSERSENLRAVSALVDIETGSRQRAVSATPPATLRNTPAVSTQALASIQERLAYCIQIGEEFVAVSVIF